MPSGYTMVGGGGTTPAGTFPPYDLVGSYIKDDFLGGTGTQGNLGARDLTANGSYGELGWTLEDSAFGGNRTNGIVKPWKFNDPAEDTEHPGMIALYSTGGGAQGGCLHLGADRGSGGSTGFDARKPFRIRVVAKLDEVTQPDLLVRIGLMYPATAVPTTTPGIMFEFDTPGRGDTNWQARFVDDNSTEHLDDTGIAPDTAWHVYEIYNDVGADTLNFSIDGVLVGTIGTYTSTFDAFDPFNQQPFFDIWGGTLLYIDYYDQYVTGFSRY